MLTLSLEKPGAATPKLALSLNKGAQFTVKVEWSCNDAHQDDVDVHALAARNDGNGAKVADLGSVLSTYNTKRMNPAGGALATNPDGSFQTPDGGLVHSGDMRVQNNFESIVIDGSKLGEAINEIPIFVTVHKAGVIGRQRTAEDDEPGFADVDVCTITLTDTDGKELGAYLLSDEFKEFNAVQLGSILRGPNGWEYAAVGRGFNGTLNDILAHFS